MITSVKNRIDRKFLSNRILEKVCNQSKAPMDSVVLWGLIPIASREIDTCQSTDGREMVIGEWTDTCHSMAPVHKSTRLSLRHDAKEAASAPHWVRFSDSPILELEPDTSENVYFQNWFISSFLFGRQNFLLRELCYMYSLLVLFCLTHLASWSI